MSPRLPQMASLPAYRQCSWSAAVRRALHGLGRISPLKAFSTFRAHRHLCLLVLRRRGTVGTLRLRERALHRQNGFGLPAARSINAPLKHDTRPDGNKQGYTFNAQT